MQRNVELKWTYDESGNEVVSFVTEGASIDFKWTDEQALMHMATNFDELARQVKEMIGKHFVVKKFVQEIPDTLEGEL